MNWTKHFADRTAHMRRTAVRELLKVTAQPDMISFAGGLPAAELFPMEQVKQATLRVLDQVGPRCLQYGETEGVPELREWIAGQFSRPLRSIKRENVAIVTGGQQALDLVGRVLLNEGDKVLVENPTYLALLSAWRPLGVQFLPVPSDALGMRVDTLDLLLRQERPKLVYLVPNFQNPQGTTLARPRREKLVQLLRSHDLGVVEDNPYGELRFSGDSLPHLLELEAATAAGESRVIYVGTFSKVLAPGLRVGWVIAAEAVIDKIVQAKQAADLHTSTLNQHFVYELVRDGLLERHIPRLRQAYGQRRDVMLAALEKYFPAGISWTRPEGGMFLMVTLPGGLDAAEVLKAALPRQVAFVPGGEFHLDGSGRNTLRLNFSNAQPRSIEEGIQRLGAVLQKMVSLRC